jgi:hypothetical protein
MSRKSERSRKRNERQARKHIELNKMESMNDKPVANPSKNEANDKKQEPSNITVAGSDRPRTSSQSQEKESRKKRKYRQYVMWPVVAIWGAIRWLVRLFDSHSATISALATVAVVGLTFVYVKYSKKQWETMRDTLQLSADAEIVIYFQNSGRLPATFIWGTMATLLAKGTMRGYSGITYTHPYHGGLWRSRDKKTGSIGGGGGSTIIAGDSVFVDTLGVISQKDLAVLPTNNMGLLTAGVFEYCDEIGTHSNRQFFLDYRSNAPATSLSFSLVSDTNFPVLLPKSTADSEYLPPCETFSEREENQKKTDKPWTLRLLGL